MRLTFLTRWQQQERSHGHAQRGTGAVRVALGLALVLIAVGSVAFAQNGGVTVEVTQGTQVVLPDGSRCLPLPPSERESVAGARVEHYCGDGVPRGLVGGILESAGQVSFEVVSLDGGQAAQDSAAGLSQLALFDVQQLVLENGGVCVRAASTTVAGDDRPAPYDCEVNGQRYVVLGTLVRDAADEYPTSYVTLAHLSDQGTVVGPDERVAVAVIDGTMPFTRTKWVLSSWGAGQAPPIAGSAPTLTFQNGMISGSTGCNSYFAPATILMEGQLMLGVAGSTLMACSEELMAQEFRFMAALDGVSGFELIWDNLYLYGGAEVITFSPATQ